MRLHANIRKATGYQQREMRKDVSWRDNRCLKVAWLSGLGCCLEEGLLAGFPADFPLTSFSSTMLPYPEAAWEAVKKTQKPRQKKKPQQSSINCLRFTRAEIGNVSM